MIGRDIRYALRQLKRSPGFAAAAVLTLALGIGSSSAIFCLLDGLWLHPLAVPHPGELVRVFSKTQDQPDGTFSWPEYQTLASRTTALKSVVAIGHRGALIPRQDGTTTLLLVNVVSSNFFESLGVRPVHGRVFAAGDAAEMRTHPGVVLGYSCWQRYFASDPNVAGRQISLLRGEHNRNSVDILGVLPPSFRELDPGSDRDLWIPAETWAALNGGRDLTSREFRWFNVLGRLAPGATVEQADQQAAAIAKTIAVDNPETNRGRGARVESDFSYRLSQAGTTGIVLFAIVGCVVVLATVNVAHLLLARGLARSGEIALRLSLGARRGTVARQLLIENLLLGVLGLVFGVGFAAAIAGLLPRLLILRPEMLVALGGTAQFAFDWRVFAFASVLALATMLLLALAPLSQAARAELLPVLQSSASTRTEGRKPRFRRAALWLQIAVSFALLVSTGTLVRSFLNTRTQSLGLTRKQVLVAFAQEPDVPMRDALLDNLRALPGVERVAYAIRSPLMPSEGGMATKVLLPSHPEMREPVDILYNAVSPGFLDLIGTRVVRGRGFAAADDQKGPAVVIVDRAMAEKYWPGRDPVGQTVKLPALGNGVDKGGAALEARIVGVTEDAPINQIGELPTPYMYIPFHLSQVGEMTVVMQTGGDAMSMAQAARGVFIRSSPLLDPMFITSLPELIRFSSGSYQMVAELVSALGLVGLALTVVGLYGFLAFGVTRRRREIGIRMALGASREATAWRVLRETATLALVGLAAGGVLAAGASRVEASMLFGVSSLDALSVLAAAAVLMVAVGAAAWLPARRAASVDPIQALRNE